MESKFYFADGFLYSIPAYKMLWLKGRFGGGKSLLAYACAEWLLAKQDFRFLVSNIPSVWGDKANDVFPSGLRVMGDEVKLDAVFILDEAGLFMRFAHQADKFLAFLRKFNVVILAPSVLPVSMLLRTFTVKREYDFSWLGVPAYVYRYKIEQETGLFTLWRPSTLFGIYSTTATPADDAGLAEMLTEVTKYARKKQKESGYDDRYIGQGFDVVEELTSDENKRQLSAGEISQVGISSEVAQLEEFAESFADLTDNLPALVKIGKRWKR